jgi:hypothetical protein
MPYGATRPADLQIAAMTAVAEPIEPIGAAEGVLS